MRNIKIITLFTMICLISSAAFGGLVIDMRNVTEQAGGLGNGQRIQANPVPLVYGRTDCI